MTDQRHVLAGHRAASTGRLARQVTERLLLPVLGDVPLDKLRGSSTG